MIEIKFSNGHLNDSQQQIVTSGLENHSEENSAPKYQKDRINWLAYENNELLAGVLTADILWDWIYIDELWVDDNHRSMGVGKQLMILAEDYAIHNNLTGLWLWTQSWQAAKFYDRLGYREFTRFADFPKGHNRIGLRKQVSANGYESEQLPGAGHY